ncbi:sensor histidine kinase [Nakamurella deserti]|uniref:sensor histidine kinase n=1 Tax=Nakamurella deserti TaxID=2164074 RepID=UPI000DBE1ED1|nr:ATP-binding protein [Nakamurella deserti]
MGRFGPRSLAGQFLVLQLVVVGLVLLVAGLVSVRQATTQFSASSGDRILGAAENLAGTPLLRGRADVNVPARVLAPLLEGARSQSGATLVLAADPDHTVIAATDPTLVGDDLTLPDGSAWEGRSWDGDLTVGGQRLIAATVPVQDEDGDVVALALVAEQYPSTWDIVASGVPELLLLLALASLAGVTGSWLLARRVKHQTHGLEPTEIANLADHREALLHSIREGVLGVGPDGVVTVANDGARELLDLPADCVGRDVTTLGLETELLDVVLGRRTGTDLPVFHRDLVLVVNRRQARTGRNGDALGAVTTLRDRSELLAVQRQLGATRNATDTLRAQTHEFDNQLHVISGLAQLGLHDELREYVTGLTRRRSEVDLALTAHIEDPALAALLVAKASLASESAVELQVSPSTRCPRLALELSTDVTTVVGNLVDNALDAVANVADAVVTVEVRADLGIAEPAVRVVVSDTGPGVSPQAADRLFERGFTTKSEAVVGGRGVGLSLVRRICESRGGSVAVRSGAGAVFVAVLPVSPADTAGPAVPAAASVEGSHR